MALQPGRSAILATLANLRVFDRLAHSGSAKRAPHVTRRDASSIDDRRAGEQLLDFPQLFVARIFAGDDQFGQPKHIFDVADVGGFGQRFAESADR